MDNDNRFETQSIASSMISSATKHGKKVPKHCLLCQNEIFKNWSDHRVKKHDGDINVKGIDCREGLCTICGDQEIKSQHSQRSRKDDRHTKQPCSECLEPKRSNTLDKVSGKCTVCMKKVQQQPSKASKNAKTATKKRTYTKSQYDNPIPNPDALEQQSSSVSEQLEEMVLDCDIVIEEDKKEAVEKPFYKPKAPSYKRLNTQGLSILNKEYSNQDKVSSFTPHQGIPILTAPIVINQGTRDETALMILRGIEEKVELDEIQQAKVTSIIPFFTQPIVITYLKEKPAVVLANIIQRLMALVHTFNEEQLVNISFAAILLGTQTWQKLPQFIGSIVNQTLRHNVIERLSTHIVKHFVDPAIAYWILENWKHLSGQTLELAMDLKVKHSAETAMILDTALVVNSSDNIEEFRLICEMFINAKDAFKLFHEAVKQQPQQPKLSLKEFIGLSFELMKFQNIGIIEEHQGDLLAKPLIEWMKLIQHWQSKSLIQDIELVQDQLALLQERYGTMPSQFKWKTISEIVPSFDHVLHQLQPQPNNIQVAMAWYSSMMLLLKSLQMIVIGAGQGKSFIQKLIVFFLLKIQAATHIHMVFTSKHLLLRDKEAFERMITTSNLDENQVSFQLGLNFHRNPSDIILLDEADQLIFSDPQTFKQLCQTNRCICLTATSDNSDVKGIERSIINSLGFEVIAPVGISTTNTMQPQIDKVVQLSNDDQLCGYIEERLKSQAVLLYCTEQTKVQLQKRFKDFLDVDRDDSSTEYIAKMDQIQPNGQYRLVASSQAKIGMRGLDYRAPVNGITLMIASSFENQREAIQGLFRVGRYKDPCERIILEGTPLVCSKQEDQYFRRLLAFVESYSKQMIVKAPAPLTLKKKAQAFADKSQNKITKFVQAQQKKLTEMEKDNEK